MLDEAPHGTMRLCVVDDQLERRGGHDDGGVLPRQVEVLHRLLEDVDGDAQGVGLLLADVEHLWRDVDPVHVASPPQQVEKQPTRPAADVQHRLPVAGDQLGIELAVVPLRRGTAEQVPILRHETRVLVVGGHRREPTTVAGATQFSRWRGRRRGPG